MRRILILPALLFLAVSTAILWWLSRPLPVLTITTWPGIYGRAQAAALIQPYGIAAHVDARIAQWEGDLDEVRLAVKSGAYKGDVIDFELPAAVKACDEGLLETIDAAALPPGTDGVPASRDFIPGAIGPCWVGSAVYSHLIIFAPGHFANPPTRAADFFDLARFPGARVLRKASPKYALELALLADGVAPGNVYKLLETQAGISRAYAKLAVLKGSILWNANAVDAVRMGSAAFAMALNGDVFDSSLHGFTPGRIWDRQLYEMDVFAIPKGDPRKERALDFIRYATGSAALAKVAEWVPLGPARRSSLPLVGRHPDLKIAMTPHLPTTPAHLATAFAVDDAWWARHEAALLPRWREFVAAD